jgi:hypothetical protein
LPPNIKRAAEQLLVGEAPLPINSPTFLASQRASFCVSRENTVKISLKIVHEKSVGGGSVFINAPNGSFRDSV